MTPTLCSECDNVAASSRKDHPRYWQCLKHKRFPGHGFVSGRDWEGAPPYGYCKDLNLGFCPLFTPSRSRAAAHEPEHAGEIE
jgi:hypothetical protein